MHLTHIQVFELRRIIKSNFCDAHNLPALPMLVIISAPYVKELISKTSLPRLLWVVVAALSILCLGVGFAGLAVI